MESPPPTGDPILAQYKAHPRVFLGPILVGGLCDQVLLGMVITQTWKYYSHHRKTDARKFKILVALLFLVNLGQSTNMFYTIVDKFAIGFGDWERLLTDVPFQVILMCDALAGALSQLFFLERAHTLLRLSHRRLSQLLLVLAIPTLLAGVALGFTCGILPFTVTRSTDSFNLLSKAIIAWKSVTVVLDVVLTATIITCLTLSRTGRTRMDSLLGGVVRWVIQAQSLPLAAAVSFLIGFVVEPKSNGPVIPSLAESKLAALSVLHVLNSRTRIRDDRPFIQSIGNLATLTLNGGEGSGEAGGRSADSKRSDGGAGRQVEVHELEVEIGRRERGAGTAADDLSLAGSLREDEDEEKGAPGRSSASG